MFVLDISLVLIYLFDSDIKQTDDRYATFGCGFKQILLVGRNQIAMTLNQWIRARWFFVNNARRTRSCMFTAVTEIPWIPPTQPHISQRSHAVSNQDTNLYGISKLLWWHYSLRNSLHRRYPQVNPENHGTLSNVLAIGRHFHSNFATARCAETRFVCGNVETFYKTHIVDDRTRGWVRIACPGYFFFFFTSIYICPDRKKNRILRW